MAEPTKYTIEVHGKDRAGKDAYVLYVGRDNQHHGYNLCTLSDFDMNGDSTRQLLTDSLNDTAAVELERKNLVRVLMGDDPSALTSVANLLYEGHYRTEEREELDSAHTSFDELPLEKQAEYKSYVVTILRATLPGDIWLAKA
jgi:hypothetical protein